MRIVIGGAFILFACAGTLQTVMAMRSVDDADKIKWQLHSIKSLGFMILFLLMFTYNG